MIKKSNAAKRNPKICKIGIISRSVYPWKPEIFPCRSIYAKRKMMRRCDEYARAVEVEGEEGGVEA